MTFSRVGGLKVLWLRLLVDGVRKRRRGISARHEKNINFLPLAGRSDGPRYRSSRSLSERNMFAAAGFVEDQREVQAEILGFE